MAMKNISLTFLSFKFLELDEFVFAKSRVAATTQFSSQVIMKFTHLGEEIMDNWVMEGHKIFDSQQESKL